MRFVTTVFGDRYSGLLLTLLQSIHRADPTTPVTVLWADIAPSSIDALRALFPQADFVHKPIPVASDLMRRISSKTFYWEAAVQHCAGEDICLLDADMLVVRPVREYFSDAFDIGYTFKNEKFPLNSGVLLIRDSPVSLPFIREWRTRTEAILTDADALAQANNRRLPYGGADQMALFQMLEYRRGQRDYRVNVNGSVATVKGFRCEELNETNSTRVTLRHHVLHYKGGWQPILLEGRPFHRNRTKVESLEMYRLYLDTYRDAIRRLRDSGSELWEQHFPIHWPSFIDRDSLSFRTTPYLMTKTTSAAQLLAGRARRLGTKLSTASGRASLIKRLRGRA
jgi:hypothetical protein